ncbi:RIP metalloprotease RseP [Candidatus Xianfuyuplasma coldseepsis]|uniref:RIP metalloprotease RseP n=1 Tax=Candidatus Xianfuyuplasma coldseepsis TaxID=2782163 RepID=A0A7L7KRU6_9MOLU|nr:RIP metalloprotease RseP [Xianfuyuplasma coldseepsis]QMS85453.1 RIP metalloprotease RseP [Xianfuyuplasma coldseepsis]
MILSIVVFLVSLSLVIILHELGHFVMARRAGILCHEFALGMGPVLWQTKKGETVYSIRAIPIGGFVMMAGEEVDEEFVKVGQRVRLAFDDTGKVSKIHLLVDQENLEQYELVTVEKVDLKGNDMAPLYLNEYEVNRDAFLVMKNRELQIAPHERGFGGKTKAQRFWAIFGGPLMNFLLAIVVFFIVNLIVGFPNTDSAEIGIIGDNYPADGIFEIGDDIISVEGVAVDSWNKMSDVLNDSMSDRDLEFVVNRDGSVMTLHVTPTLYFYSVGFRSGEDSGDSLVIGEVAEDTKAESAGFEQGDTIVSIDGIAMTTWDDVINAITTIGNLPYEEGRQVTFVVDRNGTQETLTIIEPYSAAFLETQGIDIVESRIGISPVYEFSLLKSIPTSLQDVGRSSMIIFTTIGLLFDSDDAGAGIGVDSLAGPLGIYEITSAALSQGFISLLSWIGLLSVNLGIVNLLPIPALDGGRLVFLGYEAVTGRKPNTKVENTLHYVMYIALMGLFVFITFNDLLRLLNLK